MRLALALAAPAHAAPHSATHRDPAERRLFVKLRPCPSTGRSRGACPGWVVDHVIPLCKGGADAPGNMQWQTVRDAKAKDKWECKP